MSDVSNIVHPYRIPRFELNFFSYILKVDYNLMDFHKSFYLILSISLSTHWSFLSSFLRHHSNLIPQAALSPLFFISQLIYYFFFNNMLTERCKGMSFYGSSHPVPVICPFPSHFHNGYAPSPRPCKSFHP